MRSTLARLATGSILVLALVACPATPSGGVHGVTIDGGDRTVAVGEALMLTAAVLTSGGVSDAVTWGSTDAGVATIDGDGTVDALAVGATTITATSAADPNVSDSITLTVDPPGTLMWTRQFGTVGEDLARGIATDMDGHVYTAGYTTGDLEGTNAGLYDAFVRSYDGTGTPRWTRQFGTSSLDRAYAVATGANGHVYVAGSTSGPLEGAGFGGEDAFVRAYDRDGGHRWTRQFGTGGQDSALGVTTDAEGNVYAVGFTGGALDGPSAGENDAFVRSYDADGNHRWTRQFGTPSGDVAEAVAIDATGNVYVAGTTSGALDGPNAGSYDAFLRSYDGDGTHRWTRQFGTVDDDFARAIATDADGNVYAAGDTEGSLAGLNRGSVDAFVRSYASDGTYRWTRQFGTSSADVAEAIAVAGDTTLYAVGTTSGSLDGANAGGFDAFVRSFDADGGHRWTRQFGTSSADGGRAIATDAHGDVYAAGHTYGALVGVSAGESDVFIRKFGR